MCLRSMPDPLLSIYFLLGQRANGSVSIVSLGDSPVAGDSRIGNKDVASPPVTVWSTGLAALPGGREHQCLDPLLPLPPGLGTISGGPHASTSGPGVSGDNDTKGC
uniref:Neuronal vesicle trafficking associated 2 n=1 Tax=Myotis myotis TaxID=51298 RepID=A0A7J7XIK2_MYOMY|nr:neuronal vesicle trafficking associated 2 [Myotis myotis]